MIRTLRRLTVLMAALLALATSAVITAGTASADLFTGPIVLHADEHLDAGRAVLYMQYDGNLVLYKDNRAVWDTGTWGAGPQTYAAFQSDGNLVVYINQYALWNSRTCCNFGSQLVITDDGNMVIISASGRWLWSTATGDPSPPPPDPDPCPYPPYCDDGR
ncbi:MAG TPA: hypothetical protein VGR06_12055 [Actinophytocola sp.]|jgi:hypothetical protein|uniref:hypothetical protein n=1 Tax=Actinophytocola sp. TaxID=1872138 RepID=UPI002E00354C|nr:hypothetical protein [Actinophytocola sp.]